MLTELDAETLLPIQKHSYWFDLEKANSEGHPKWQSHDYLKSYKMDDMSPESHMKLANRIKDDH